ncbi:MAG TPA: metalloregulator ArsR/SmtB family transcription factor [Acidimicrobiia bacterium]|nr:metalloregulator ArsR/SmtB family transcription factor [Acidimicrobiia bacterium]
MAVSTTLEILATPTRRELLDALREGEQPVSELVRRVALSQPAVSKQLRILRDAGLVTVRADGQRRIYRLRSEPLAELFDWLTPYRELWESSLDRLAQHLTPQSPADDEESPR